MVTLPNLPWGVNFLPTCHGSQPCGGRDVLGNHTELDDFSWDFSLDMRKCGRVAV